jgi:hypothetical protein
MALYCDGIHRVSLDQAIKMRQTEMGIYAKYNERRSAGWRSTYRSVEGRDPRDGRARVEVHRLTASNGRVSREGERASQRSAASSP